ncbi:ddrB domain protein [Escherichia coli]|nr:ddrB domain protein [Escherichia coli]
MVQRLSLIFTDHTALGDLTLDEMKEASIQWADQQNEVNSDFLPAFRKAVSKADDARGILKAFKALQSRVNKHVGDIDGVTAEGRDILKEHGITPEFIDEIRTDMQREVVSSLQIVARALADANPKSAAIVNRVIGDIEASEGMGALKLFLSRAFNPNGNILPGIIGEAKRYVSEEELEQLDQLLKRFSYNPQTRWQMNQRSMGSVHEKVLSAMNSAIANSSVSEEKALEWADSFITEEVEEARAGQNGGIDLRKELADIYRLTGGKISTLSKVVHHQGRAYANLNGVVAVNLNDENASALWHELGHHLEYSNPGLLEKARSFLKANVEGDKPSFVNIGGRGKPEWCFRSRLSNIYMAKVYPPVSVSNSGKIRQKSPTISKTSATEVFSMALQLYHDKEAAAASLMNGDGLLELLLGVAKELNNAD